jgi:hypothetical protein
VTVPVGSQREPEFWLLRLHNGKMSYHWYMTEATREKWAAKYRACGDRVSYEHSIAIPTARADR